MKKILFLLFLFAVVSGCALMPVTNRTLDQRLDDYATKDDLRVLALSGSISADDLSELISILKNTGANKIRAFTGKTGGTSGMLDSVSVSSLSNNDLALVFDVSGSDMYFYKFNSTATDAESDPDFIRPDDYSSAGVWYLMSGFNFGRSSEPQLLFRDSSCTDADNNARIYVDCSTTTSEHEDCDVYIQVQKDGSITTKITIDADGQVSIADSVFNPGAGMVSQTPMTDAAADFAANFTGAYLYGGTFICDTAGTIQLPVMAVGMNFTIITKGAIAVVIDTNAADGYLMDGTEGAEGNNLTNLSTAGDIAVIQYYTADDWLITTNGWTPE